MTAERFQTSFWQRTARSVRRRIGFLVVTNAALLVLIAWRTRSVGSSFSAELNQMLPNVAPSVLAGLGLTGIVCCGAIDLSIGSILAVAGTVYGVLDSRGFAPSVAFSGCFLAAFALSAWNGLLVRALKIPAIIVTLGGLSFYRGVALIVADVSARGFSEQFTLGEAAFHRHSGLLLMLASSAAIAWEAFGKTPRLFLAVGNSPRACRLGGIAAERVLLTAYVVGGLFLGLAAIADVANRITIEPARLGLGFELEVIAAVVLGGTSIFGGQGSYLGTILGGVFFYLVGRTLLYAGINEYWRSAAQGAAILIVIGVDCGLSRRQKLLEELK